MKILVLACMLVLLSCGKQESFKLDPLPADSIAPHNNVAYETKPDTVKKINIILNDTLKLEYTNKSYSGFEKWFKEMALKEIMPPDKAYEDFMSLDGYKAISIDFDSEVGQDAFYLLYAYFLQQINGKEKYYRERQELTTAYQSINKLKSYYQYGGTYFGHMYDRIYGYSEYSIYTLDKSLNNESDVVVGKSAFISMLKKVYTEKLKEDGDTPPHEKPEKLKRMMEMIDSIGNNIYNASILKEVKQFYADHYNYWM